MFVVQSYLSVSLTFPAEPAVFFRFGTGILHSMENATQFVHGTPRLAASHRTYNLTISSCALIDHSTRPFSLLVGEVSHVVALRQAISLCSNLTDHLLFPSHIMCLDIAYLSRMASL